jgi:hypothetical protein
MSKMGSHDPLNTYNTSYDWKKGQESKCQFDSQPLKIGNHIKLCAYKWHATYCWKVIDEGNNFALDSFQLKVYIRNYGLPKFCESQFWKFWDSQLGSPGTKWHLHAAPMVITKNTIRGKVTASLKFGLWWVLWVCVCPWFICALKMLQLCTNQLVV